MKSLTESPAILTVHTGSPGQYILRTTDLSHRPLVIAVTKLLTDAQSFVVITPTDVKVFSVGSNGDQPQQYEETQAAIEFEESANLPPSSVGDGNTVDMGSNAESESEPVPARTRRRTKTEKIAGHDEACGRCSGQGQVSMSMPDGQAAHAACPICKGSGIMIRYGNRR